MSVNVPSGNLQHGDLARTINHEISDDWPTLIEIVAYFGPNGRKGKRKSVEISADQFFGRNGYGAPMGADQFNLIINQLRKAK